MRVDVISIAQLVASVFIQPFIGSINALFPISLRATVPSAGLANFSWSITSAAGTPVPESAFTLQTSAVLTLAAAALQPGQLYTAALRCVYDDGVQGSATVDFATAASPVGGSCSVSPTTGNVSTLFTIACISVTDLPADMPLVYQFFAVSASRCC